MTTKTSLFGLMRVLACVSALLLASFAMAQSTNWVSDRILVKFHEGTPNAHAVAEIRSVGGMEVGLIYHTGVIVISLRGNAGVAEAVEAIGHKADVEFCEPDVIVPVSQTVTPNDPGFPNSWHLSKIACPTAWSYNVGSPSVTIAILDTGCEPTHPDLVNNYVAGWNFYDNNSNTADVFGHGTEVAGAAAAVGNNSQGGCGVAWNANHDHLPLVMETVGQPPFLALCRSYTIQRSPS